MMKKKDFQPLRGMKDLPPAEMRVHTYIKAGIDKVAQQFCYEEYNLPLLEALSTFAHQESTELLKEQSYTFTDRGGRAVILRPEITPILARMLAREQRKYSLPLRWYTVGNCYRYEKPQAGRYREFAQLNFDLFGNYELNYDLEIFQLIHALMKEFNVPPTAYTLRYNHRGIVDSLLAQHDFTHDDKQRFYALIDKKRKMTPQQFAEMIEKQFVTTPQRAFIQHYSSMRTAKELDEILIAEKLSPSEQTTRNQFFQMTAFLEEMPNSLPAIYDPTIVRGIDYYTGVVFEVFAEINKDNSDHSVKRSLFGGGRYDKLLAQYSTQALGAVGLGMGIDIFALFLKELGLLTLPQRYKIKIYLSPPLSATDKEHLAALSLVYQMRNHFLTTFPTYSLMIGPLGKSLDWHSKKARKADCSHIVLSRKNELENLEINLQPLNPHAAALSQDFITALRSFVKTPQKIYSH